MTGLVSLTSFVPPVPILPVQPNFAYCNGAYGTGLEGNDAMKAAGLLPQGTIPVTYSVGVPDMDGLAANVSASEKVYQLPFLQFFGGVSLSADISGPVDIDRINLVPNDVRGMAAYLAVHCVRPYGLGGFVTKKLQGLVDFVTDPTSDIDSELYPDSTAFLTLTISDHENSHTFPGDYDPQMANFLRHVETQAVSRTPPRYQAVIIDRVRRFVVAMTRMHRLGTEVPWWGPGLVQGNETATANDHLANMTTEGLATTRRRRRMRGLLR